MDQLNDFMITHYPTTKTAAEPQSEQVIELTEVEKRAYGSALHDLSLDENFLGQFEGTPLAPQAIALAEQGLALEQRHLQARMARAATQQNDNYMQECNERDALRLQQSQLLIQLYKMKVMGAGAQEPGQAVIGEPQPGAPAELGMGADAGSPVPEGGANPAQNIKMALLTYAQRLRAK